MKMLSAFTLLLATNTAIAQWNAETQINTPVTTSTNWQIDLRMVEDGDKGTFIVWKDYRNGTPDIYAQHIDSNGVALWEYNGAPVCTQTADQSTPGILLDGEGGIIVSWSDWRSGIERDIYAQRLNEFGQPIWPLNGVVVVNKVNREHNQRMVSDGAGGAIVVFEQKNSSTYLWEIWAQRIDALGNAVWNSGGVPVSGFISEHLNERIQSDGQGGVYVTFQDFRNGFDFDVYVQHLDGNGNRLWNTGVLACNAPGTQTNPKIDPDYLTGGVVVTWTDKRNGFDYDVYAQRIDSTGNVLWSSNGIAVGAEIGNQSAVDILSNSNSNGVIVTWRDGRNGHDDIFIDKISPEGISSWQQNGVLLSASNFNKLNPNICSDGNGGAIVAWQDSTINDWDVYSQKINSVGQIQWISGGMVVSSAIEIQSHPKNVPDGSGGSIYVWQDKRANQYDIYCHHLNDQGQGIRTESLDDFEMAVFPNPTTGYVQINSKIRIDGIRICNSVGNILQQEYFIAGMNAVLNLNTLPSGIYIVEVIAGHQKARKAIMKY